MTENIFEGTTPPEVAPSTTPVTPTATVPTELAELVGEGKKYSSVEAALKSIPHAQSHISTLEQENARIKAELEARRTTEDLLEDIRNGFVQPAAATTAPVVDPAQIEKTIETLLSRKEQQRSVQANLQTVISKFTEAFGSKEKGEEAFYKLAEENGLDAQSLNGLAATSPKAVFKMAGLDSTKPTIPGKPSSTVNTESFNQGGSQELSAKVSMVGASTKDVNQAWKNAGEKVKQKYNSN